MLIVGTNTLRILEHLPESFLLIDDGINFTPPRNRKVTYFDPYKDSINPVQNISYRRAEDFCSLIDAVFPSGENTLTKQNSSIALMEVLLENKKSLDAISFPKDDYSQAAAMKVKRLLLSPVLKNVLCNRTSITFKGIVIAKLNRAELGDFDTKVLGNLLIMSYPGDVVVNGYGFFAASFHENILKRLTARVNYLDELPDNLRMAFMLGEKLASHCTHDDAVELAKYIPGLKKDTVGYKDFIEEAVK